jgi:dihydrodipicolinate synthase/N-acetylneuraminate lyase
MSSAGLRPEIASLLRTGGVIPAHPLALDSTRHLDERRQRALTRYYIDSGAIGVAIAVHTTQFAIRNPEVGLLEPVLRLGREVVESFEGKGRTVITIAGVVGRTDQALREAALAADLGYDLIMPQLGAFVGASEKELIGHCSRLAEMRPIFGFYLQPAVGGRPLSYRFWREFSEIDNVLAIKIAPFNRYQTVDVLRGVVESSRSDVIALYTGNDDHIVLDLLTPYHFKTPGGDKTLRFVGGLLGHWAVWTRAAVEWCSRARAAADSGAAVDAALLQLANEVTDSNAALFDPQNGFAGCIAGVHEILRRQGLLAGRWCLDPKEDLSPGQIPEIDRVVRAYPHLVDDEFVRDNLDRWLK